MCFSDRDQKRHHKLGADYDRMVHEAGIFSKYVELRIDA